MPSPATPMPGSDQSAPADRPRGLRLMRLLAASLWLLLCAAPAALAGGFLSNSTPKQPEKREFVAPAARMPVEGEGQEAIEADLHNAELRVKEAQQNAETADWVYTRSRTRRYPRGEALQAIKDRQAEMAKERDSAEADFSAQVEKARRSGVPAGTLQPYMDLDDQIRRQQSERLVAEEE